MGVTGLWTVVAPTARPTQLASLNRKRLAVDASIWIYQFLKAVRDKEGNALRNSHIVGFFRRICKLLYFGIKPVFVFDGGAPILKRETIRKRARRREGRREDAVRTAGKLLAVQVARAAEEEEKRRRAERERTPVEAELPDDQELVYVDEIGMSQKERLAGRGFKKKDQYHLPDLDISIENMGAPNDPRIMSQAELEEYARQFHSGEDINLYDFSKIDFESPFFLSLPPGDRYNILNAARLRSRLRMGYSKEQLDGMFPDRMAFSRFQIERVKERNELTQRLMHINGMAEDFLNQGGRIAGEKGKEYVLVKNDGVEGGWALGVVSNKKGTQRENAIDLEEADQSDSDVEASEEHEDFEDVEIEGLNRIPKVWQRKRKDIDFGTNHEEAAAEIARKRKAIYEARAQKTPKPIPHSLGAPKVVSEADDLFVRQENETPDDGEDGVDDLFEDVDLSLQDDESDDELQRAIALSLEQPESNDREFAGGFFVSGELQSSVLNEQAGANFGKDDEVMDLSSALAESRHSKKKSNTTNMKKSSVKERKFDGPLPFESLNLGQSLLGKKKAKKIDESLSGGFDRNLGDDAFRKEKPAQPIPSWFHSTPIVKGHRNNHENEEDMSYDENPRRLEQMTKGKLQSTDRTVIDLDEDIQSKNIVVVNSSDEDELSHSSQAFEPFNETVDNVVENDEQRSLQEQREIERNDRYRIAQEIADQNAVEDETEVDVTETTMATSKSEKQTSTSLAYDPNGGRDFAQEQEKDSVDWSESESENGIFHREEEKIEHSSEFPSPAQPQRQEVIELTEEDDGEKFEDVEMAVEEPNTVASQQHPLTNAEMRLTSQFLIADGSNENDSGQTEDQNAMQTAGDEDYLSDSDEELMRQLAIEAEEHERFASSLNNKTPDQMARDYENELKQLRNQQKKDRRDADEVTQTMIQECQALLGLFGLPYITAPMEAEAQCAELVQLGLVDGIVTDDSDVFLFGGTRVYKNMFNAAKFVECYLISDLEREYALDRKKLVRFAHLLGSDYTEGIPGVGPVTALEILTDFPTLEEFKEWCTKVQLGRPQDLENQLSTPFRRKFKGTVQKRLFLPPGFPDIRVDEAYLQPDVDSDPQEFQWGIPDLDKLRSFLMMTIGWSQERTDEILVPVIRDMNKRGIEGTQSNITRFFSGGVGVGATKEGDAPRKKSDKESGRMAKAYKRLRVEAERRRHDDLPNDLPEGIENVENDSVGGNSDEVGDNRSRTGSKRKATKQAEKSGDDGNDGEDESPSSQSQRTRKKKGKRNTKKS